MAGAMTGSGYVAYDNEVSPDVIEGGFESNFSLFSELARDEGRTGNSNATPGDHEFPLAFLECFAFLFPFQLIFDHDPFFGEPSETRAHSDDLALFGVSPLSLLLLRGLPLAPVESECLNLILSPNAPMLPSKSFFHLEYPERPLCRLAFPFTGLRLDGPS
jgi:hypothetical protein